MGKTACILPATPDNVPWALSGSLTATPKRWILLQERRSGLEGLHDETFSAGQRARQDSTPRPAA